MVALAGDQIDRWSLQTQGGVAMMVVKAMVDSMMMEVACFRLCDCEIAGDNAAVRSWMACHRM
jgi:hypothetical protein